MCEVACCILLLHMRLKETLWGFLLHILYKMNNLHNTAVLLRLQEQTFIDD